MYPKPKHAADLEGSKLLEKRFGFKPACFRCRSWRFEWQEKERSYWLQCEMCSLEYSIRKPIPAYSFIEGKIVSE